MYGTVPHVNKRLPIQLSCTHIHLGVSERTSWLHILGEAQWTVFAAWSNLEGKQGLLDDMQAAMPHNRVSDPHACLAAQHGPHRGPESLACQRPINCAACTVPLTSTAIGSGQCQVYSEEVGQVEGQGSPSMLSDGTACRRTGECSAMDIFACLQACSL